MNALRMPPKAAKNTFGAPRELPASVVRWIDSAEGIERIRAALDAAAITSADFEKDSIVSRELLNRPLSIF